MKTFKTMKLKNKKILQILKFFNCSLCDLSYLLVWYFINQFIATDSRRANHHSLLAYFVVST